MTRHTAVGLSEKLLWCYKSSSAESIKNFVIILNVLWPMRMFNNLAFSVIFWVKLTQKSSCRLPITIGRILWKAPQGMFFFLNRVDISWFETTLHMMKNSCPVTSLSIKHFHSTSIAGAIFLKSQVALVCVAANVMLKENVFMKLRSCYLYIW